MNVKVLMCRITRSEVPVLQLLVTPKLENAVKDHRQVKCTKM